MDSTYFAKLYKGWTIDQLLDIIEKPTNYQPVAVEIAKRELEIRGLTDEQFQEAKKLRSQKLKVEANEKKKIKAIESKFISIAESINPIQSQVPTTDRNIKLITLFLIGLFLYQLYTGFWAIRILFNNFDIVNAILLLPVFLIPIAALLFWLGKKRGWILTSMYATYSAITGLLNFFSEVGSQPDRPVFDFGIPSTPPIAYFGTFVLFGSLLLTLCKEGIKEKYNISKNDLLNSMIFGGVIAVFIFIYTS